MRYAFIAFVLCACSVVRGEDAANNAPSVLNHGQPTAAATSQADIVSAPATVTTCENGTCTTERSCRSSCRQGLFGRTIERTREVTRAVVEVPVQVVKAPVRVVRARRGCCNCR